MYIITHDHQFAFKSEHSADMCIFSAKSIMKYYTDHGSPVFTCFLDASKTFDRINHWTLFRKIIDSKMSLIIVRIIMFWYQSQLVCVKWGKVVSNFFRISNGVWQGGILSPKLFALYMNKLSRLLVMSNVGCYIDGQCTNHLMYADDICILAPTAIAMQQLLDICNDYGVANDITFNPLTSVCLVFRPAKYKLFCPRVHIGSAQLEYVYDAKYLGFMFCENKKDDCDMLRQLRTIYAKSNKIIRTFSHCTIDVKLLLIKSYCTSFYCGYM